ncbi:MAG: imidazole glycerol phosphate synthase subunit HisH [Planctomycetia bacterium]|nr:imidazole glycerol phosphate synthase subunit HisH [Planctomycetia bacterium]
MITIVDYKAGNVTSVLRAIQHLGFEGRISARCEDILSSQRVIFPGVGAAGATMDELRRSGLADALLEFHNGGRPMLGICIGIQIIFEESEEDGARCLGMLKGRVRRFPPDAGLKVPQIGWNQVNRRSDHPLFDGVTDGAEFYFVNSYYAEPEDKDIVLATTVYGVEFASMVVSGNLVATQFHLEKSGKVGLAMLKNFCNWRGP